MWSYPSVYAHALSGILILVFVIMIVMNFSTIRKEPLSYLLIVVLLASCAIGIHGISHLGMEKNYGINPLQ